MIVCYFLVIGCVNTLKSASMQVILDFMALSFFENVPRFYSILSNQVKIKSGEKRKLNTIFFTNNMNSCEGLFQY